MTDKPILFSPPMVRAILREIEKPGTGKTMTRRVAYKASAFGGETATDWYEIYKHWAFRPIEGYQDYLAGRDGLIYTTKGSGEPRPMKGSPSSKGYLTVSLCNPDGIKTKSVHRLVAEAWLGPQPGSGMEVRHLNADRTDNRLENLDWGTPSDNWADRLAHGNGVGEDHHAAKLTMAHAKAIRASAASQRTLAKEYGVSQSVIWAIKAGHIWREAPQASGRNIALPEPPRLWVRETWKSVAAGEVKRGYGEVRYGTAYKADGHVSWAARPTIIHDLTGQPDSGPMQFQPEPWRPSMFMPRWASRLTLTVTAVKVERLQDISVGDAIREGIEPGPHSFGWRCYLPEPKSQDYWASPRESFRTLWTSINGPDAWAANPWVAAYTFTPALGNIDQAERSAA